MRLTSTLADIVAVSAITLAKWIAGIAAFTLVAGVILSIVKPGMVAGLNSVFPMAPDDPGMAGIVLAVVLCVPVLLMILFVRPKPKT